MKTLQNRGLIRESHTDPETGAIFYVTTDLLLTELGIESLESTTPALASPR
jgi:segregation and condensation protein B